MTKAKYKFIIRDWINTSYEDVCASAECDLDKTLTILLTLMTQYMANKRWGMEEVIMSLRSVLYPNEVVNPYSTEYDVMIDITDKQKWNIYLKDNQILTKKLYGRVVWGDSFIKELDIIDE